MSASEGSSFRSLSEISEVDTVRLSIDLVSAARRNLGFLRLVSDVAWLHQKPTILESIRRYDELWMPLMANLSVGSTQPIVLPPLDIEWVWFCHTLNPVSYKQYCESRFSKIIGKPAIFNEEIKEYAVNKCKEIWVSLYTCEPFENEGDDSSTEDLIVNEDLLSVVLKQRYLYAKFTEPYRAEIVYLIAARQRYKAFLYLTNRFSDGYTRLVPTPDVLLIWLTHQSYPSVYLLDIKELDDKIDKVLGPWEAVKEEEIKETKKLWEKTFNQPFEKGGGEVIAKSAETRQPLSWEVTDFDVNTKYRSMVPRFLLEACVMVKLNPKTGTKQGDFSKEFLRLRVVRCHRELKVDKLICDFTSASWRKAWHVYCEFGTKGLILELRQHGGSCFKGSRLQDSITFPWNDLLRAPSLTLSKEIGQVTAVASITPPAQASYLLKCVPDRVTDDSGAMISDVILKLNQYRPQEGRWLSRTVLDHAGRECFVIRIRIGGGFWRRGGEAPSTVKWEERIVEIREGTWSYVAGSIGKAPERVIGMAEPKEPPEGWQALWNFSTGEELLIRWGSSTSTSSLSFDMRNQQAADSKVKLLVGRKMQYQVTKSGLDAKDHEHKQEEALAEVEKQDDGFVTLVRFSEDNPIGKATALLNWKLMAVELSPEEDAVFILMLCMSIVRSITERTKEDVGSLLVRRRIKEAKLGDRDWGSVVLHPSYSSSISSPHLQPWYWNAEAVMAPQRMDQPTKPPALNYSQAEGGDKLYKKGIIS